MGAPLPVAPLRGSPTMNEKLRFIVVGAGGLGCPALLGLVAAGARRLTIIDDDVVDLSNLPRQVLYESADVGVAKLDAARWALLARARSRGELDIHTLARRVGVDVDAVTALLRELVPARDDAIVLECSDSPKLKFAVHDACMRLGLRVVIGGVVGWHGQVMAVDPRRRDVACYRCLFEAPPPAELSPACATVGVIGPAAGTLGHALAHSAVALAEASPTAEHSPAGACLHFDLLSGSVRRLAPAPRPDCVVCRETAHQPQPKHT